MRNAILFSVIMILNITISAQLVITVEMEGENVEGICDHNKVYVLYDGFEGQSAPKCSLSKGKMQKQLNQIIFFKEQPKFKGKGTIGVYINCKGEALNWEVSKSTRNTLLDKQLLDVFITFTDWSTGTLDERNVDCHEFISYRIKKGKVEIQ